MANAHLTPIQKDAAFFLGGLAILLVGVWAAVSFGINFGPGAGIEPWAIALLLGVAIAFSASAVWWYYVYPEERQPARGEFTIERAADGKHVREGTGTFRSKAPGPGVREEPEYRMTTEPGFVPRTVPRWALWFLLMLGALLAAGGLASYSRTAEDPLSPLMVAVGLLGAAVMLGALGVGEMSHQGAWARHERRP